MTKLPHPDGPAMLKEGHSQTRVLSTVAGAPKGYRNEREHPLFLAEVRGWIDGDEFAAGEFYRSMFEKIGRSGRDSTDFVVVSGSRQPFTDAQVAAIRIIQGIEQALEKLDRDVPKSNWVTIIRKFCGEGWSMAASVKAAGYSNPRFTKHRIKLALNKLSVAISKTKIDFRPSE